MVALEVRSLKEYMLETYEQYADLSSARYRELNYLLDAYGAYKYTRLQFCEEFGLEGVSFYRLLKVLTSPKNFKPLVAFGRKFTNEKVEKSLF